MDVLRREGVLCDCVLLADDGTRFFAHKTMLAAKIPYFRALFIHDQQPMVAAQESESEMLLRCCSENRRHMFGVREVITEENSQLISLVLDYVYGIPITMEKLTFWDAETLMPLADRWNMTGLMSECALYLQRNVTVDNCVGIWSFSRMYNCYELESACYKFILYNVQEIAIDGESIEWYRLNKDEIISFLEDDMLNVKSEDAVFDIISLWINAVEQDGHNRLCHLPELMRTIRFGLCSKEFVFEYLNKHPYICNNEEVKSTIDQLIATQFTPEEEPILNRPRIPSNLIFTVGGWTNGAPTGAIETYDSKANRWFVLDEYMDINPRAYHAMVVIDQQLFVVGGFDGSEYYNSCRCFDAATGKWREAAPMYVARCYIYAVGGFDGRVRLSSAEKYEPVNNQWTLIQPMTRARSDASVTTYKGRLYVAGGFNGEDVLRSVEIYSPLTDIWQEAAEMLTPRSGVSLIAHQSYLYVIGGFDGQHRLTTAERYDRETLRWISVASMNTPRSNFALSILDDHIYVIGGFDGNTTISGVERFEPETNQWKCVNFMNFNRSAVKAAVIRNCPNAIHYSYHGRRRKG